MNDCKYGALCAKIADSEYYTCINYLSVNEDVKVSSEFPEKNHKVCKSLAFDNITNTCSPIESTKDGWFKIFKFYIYNKIIINIFNNQS